MRCPECHAPRDPNAATCPDCGLLFVALPEPSRREEDRVRKKRRASDAELTECPACKGAVPRSAVRCRHCSEVLDPKYLARKARKRRAQVNAASWMAYLLGLVTLFIFRPVGLISIAVGLALSILYYLIPVEEELPFEDDERGERGEESDSGGSGTSARSLFRYLERQFALERFTFRVPHLPKLRLVFVGTPLIAAVIGLGANYFLLQLPMNRILDTSSMFRDVGVSAHYKYWIIPGVVVYDVNAGSGTEASRAIAELAHLTRQEDVSEVRVEVEGRERVKIDGSQFRRIGVALERESARQVVAQFRQIFQPLEGNSPLPDPLDAAGLARTTPESGGPSPRITIQTDSSP